MSSTMPAAPATKVACASWAAVIGVDGLGGDLIAVDDEVAAVGRRY